MPSMLEKIELIKSVVEPSQFDRFWIDTLHPSGGSALVSFPESISGCDVQVVYIPVAKKSKPMTAKARLHALMERTPKMPDGSYQFRRADAYDEELA